MEFKQAVITDRGRALMTKLLAGKITQFTKIAVSETKYNDNQLASLTALSNIKSESPVSVSTTNATNILATGGVNNVGLQVGYYVNTVGLYANDPDLGEILYSVVSAVDGKNSYIPPDTGVSQSGVTFKIQTEVAKADNVNMSVDPANVATQGDLDRMKKPFQAWANSADGKTDFTKVYPNENLVDYNTDFPTELPRLFSVGGSIRTVTYDVAISELGITRGVKYSFLGGSSTTVAGFPNFTQAKIGEYYTVSVYLKNLSKFPIYLLLESTKTLIPENFVGRVTVTYKATVTNCQPVILKNSITDNNVEFIAYREKIELGKVATPWASLKREDKANSVMKFTGFCNQDSNNGADYIWLPSPESRSMSYDAWANDKNGKDFSLVPRGENLVTKAIFTNANIKTTTLDYTAPLFTSADIGNKLSGKSQVSVTFKINVTAIESVASNPLIWLRHVGGSYFKLSEQKSIRDIKVGDTIILESSMSYTDLTNISNFGVGVYNALLTFKIYDLAIKIGPDKQYSPAPIDDKLGSIFTYHGTTPSPSKDPLDYSWGKSDELRDFELQQIRTAIIAMGGSM